MAKTDIEDAFRIIPINPDDYHLLCFSWNNEYYYECVLPMGASSSCKIFEAFSTALQWIMINRYNAGGMSHILDDFFFIGPPNSSACRNDLNTFLALSERIGVPIKMEKTQFPCTKLTIYGIEVDSTEMESRLPPDKIEKIRSALRNIANCKRVTLKKLQSLIGLLNFACCIVCPGL